MTAEAPAATPVVAASREQALADVFVDLADTLVEDYDVVDLLDRLVTACVSLLPVAAAGILLDDQQGHLAVVASSSEESRLLEIFQLQNDEGPCLECVQNSAVVTSTDLEADRVRWPLFAGAALGSGFHSVVALPLRLREQTIGGLNLFQEGPAPLGQAEQRLAQAFADVATIGILQRRSAHRSTMIAEQLQHALDSRVVIEQAKGVLAERNNVTLEDAYSALRKHARDNNLKLTGLALAVVRGDLDTRTLSPPPAAG